MNCDELRSRVSELLDQELSYTDSQKFQQHLDGCHSCSELLTGLEQMQVALAQAPPVSLRPEFSARLQARLRADLARRDAWWQRLAIPGRAGLSPLSMGGLVAAGLSAVLVGVSLFQRDAAPLIAPPASAAQVADPVPGSAPSTLDPGFPTAVQAASMADSLKPESDSSRRDFSRQLRLVDQKRP